MYWRIIALLLFFQVGVCFSAEPTLTPDGIKFSLQGLDDLVFSWPQLQDSSQKDLAKIFDKTVSDGGKRAVVKYEGGHEVHFVRKDGGLIEMSVKNPPGDLKSFRMGCNIPFAINEGGKYSLAGQDAKPFPMEKPEKPFLYQGNTRTMTLTAPSGAVLTFGGLQDGTYFQLQDNREWNWPIFHVWFSCPYNADHAFTELRFSSGKDAEHKVTKMVDRFGQDFVRDFPDKIKSEEELKADAAADEKYYASFPKQKGLDAYGGFDGTDKSFGLKKTGFFHVQRAKDQWFLVDPAGNAFFHRALCGFGPSDDFTYTEGRDSIFEWLPPHDEKFGSAWHPDGWWNPRAVSFYLANVIRKYDKPFEREEWTGRMIDRVRAMGFTSAGAFSPTPKVYTEKNFPHARSFGFWGLGHDIPGARGFFDAFDPELAKKIDENFAKSIAPAANDPLIIGYYLANEQGAEDLPKALPALSGNFATKKELVAFLKKKYGTADKFNTAWGMDVKSFDDLVEPGLPVTTRQASQDVSAFVGIYLDKYYSLLAETFKKYDKNHMLIGNRWQPGTANNETLVKTCAKYCDVISVNYYTVAFDKSFLDRLYKWSGEKPMLLSEWHYSSTADTGLPGGLGSVSSQKERGLAYRNYVEQAAATGYVVGIEWFTLIDQARAGRFFELNTGEKANTGIFAVSDRPWKDFVAEAAKTNLDIQNVLFGKRKPFQFDDPRFVPKGTGRQTVNAPWVEKALQIDASRDDWPGLPPMLIGENRMVIGSDSAGVSGAFRVAWDEKNLYVFVDVTDKTPGKSDVKGADLWQGDGIELFLGFEELDTPGGLIFSDRQILIGAGPGSSRDQIFVRNAADASTGAIDRKVLVKPDGNGYYLEAAIPFTLLDWKPKEGAEILFDIAIDDSENGESRARQFVWNGDNRVSGERGGWGRLRFTK